MTVTGTNDVYNEKPIAMPVYHKSHKDCPGIESDYLLWKAGD